MNTLYKILFVILLKGTRKKYWIDKLLNVYVVIVGANNWTKEESFNKGNVTYHDVDDIDYKRVFIWQLKHPKF